MDRTASDDSGEREASSSPRETHAGEAGVDGQFRQIVDAMPQIAWIADATGRVLYVNQRWHDYTGLTLADTQVGTLLLSVIHPDDFDGMMKVWSSKLESGTDYEYQARFRRARDGEYRWFLCRGVPVKDAQGRVAKWFGTSTDIEEEKVAQRRLLEADRRKDVFLATLAHELRNPLAPIRNAAQLLRLKASGDADLQRARDMIERQVDHLARLVDDLLDVSRITHGKLEMQSEPLLLGSIIEYAVEVSRPLIEARRHRLIVDQAPHDIRLRGDSARLAQSLANVLTNAVKYTEPGGLIQVKTRQEGAQCLISVKDNGIGIPCELLPNIFELFTQGDRTLDRSQGGLGIGLSLVRRLVELHGGTIEACSEGEGRGSEFILRLPVDETADIALPMPVADIQQAAPRRVLVVDDNKDAADSMASLLRMQHHVVQTAYSGPAALGAARVFRPEIVFLDIGLPGMDGFEIARRLRQFPETRGSRLIALTGYGQAEDRRRSEEAGFDQHCVKPLDPRALAALLAQ
jgi:PAS domain S-box-containing protein